MSRKVSSLLWPANGLGGVPIIAGGEAIGAVGVSGLSETDDIELARLGVAAFGGD